MRRLGPLAIAAALTLALSPASADEHEIDYARGGLYGSVSGAVAVDNFQRGGHHSNSLAFDGRVGWRLHRNAAAEAEFEIHGFDFQAVNAMGRQVNPVIDTMVWTANLKAFPLTGRLQPYLVAGVGLMALDFDSAVGSENDVGIATRFGAGFDLYVTENFSLTVGSTYVLPFGPTSDFDYVSFTAGIQYILRSRTD